MLDVEGKATPTRIASEIGADKRTTKKLLATVANLGLVEYNSLEAGGRTYAAYRLSSIGKDVARKLKEREAWK
jgi:predicted transcriptional regulator